MTCVNLVGFATPSGGRPLLAAVVAAPMRRLWVLYSFVHSHTFVSGDAVPIYCGVVDRKVFFIDEIIDAAAFGCRQVHDDPPFPILLRHSSHP